jgi:hypothetical protein
MRPTDRAVVFLDFDGVLHPVGVPAVDVQRTLSARLAGLSLNEV